MSMHIINSFLTSGHQFSKDENLQRFRFSLLNASMLIASFFTFLNYFASVFKLIPFPPLYEKIVLFYAISCVFSIFILRLKKSYFFIASNIVVLTSLIVFYAALFMIKDDEFRLIWFFLVTFASFVLLGKRYGIVLMSLILMSILIINQSYDLGFSKLAQFSFFNSFLIFAAFSYFFLEKIEKDSLEFQSLNSQLKDKINHEKQQREEQEQMLLRQCRMANMGEMLDSIAHQWRQPLMHINSILLNMDGALESESSNKRNKAYLDDKIVEISTLTEHMSQTIEDFRNLFKIENKQTHFTIKSVIDDVLALMKNNVHNIEVSHNYIDDISVFANKSELLQVVIIILSNAVDVLKIRDVATKKIHITLSNHEGSAFISIEDNAGGIRPNNLDKIFDPYFTSKKQSGGTGLGLYIAKIIVEQNFKGQLSAENTAHGAKFTIKLGKENAVNS